MSEECLHDFALFWDGKRLRWRCYYCGKYLEEIPENELDESDLLLKRWLHNAVSGDERGMEKLV